MENKYILIGKDEVEASRVAQGDEQAYVEKVGNIESVVDLEAVFQEFSSDWVFRGQSDARWALNPSIQRDRKYIDWDSYEEPIIDALASSQLVLKKWPQFQKFSYLEKLGFVQHYGGVTRFLDFSYDWHVACFFALNFDRTVWGKLLNGKKSKTLKYCAVWAINVKEIKKMALQLMQAKWSSIPDSEDGILDTIIKTDKVAPFVYPFDLKQNKNTRMQRQQGLLLVQCDSCLSFGNNLFNISEDQSLEVNYEHCASIGKKIYIPFSLGHEIYGYLSGLGFTRKQLLSEEEFFRRMKKIIQQVEIEAMKRTKPRVK